MVFVRDEGGVDDAPLDVVWDFFSSGKARSEAHHHRNVRRQKLTEDSGSYTWVQDFRGELVHFTMRWTSFAPLGLAYDVLEGPFAGSKFFLYYTPRGERTEVAIVGEFTSPTIPASEVVKALGQFFATEFAQDSEAIRQRMERRKARQ